MKVSALVVPRPGDIRRDLPVMLASAFLATLAITTITYVEPWLGLPQVDLPIWVARVFVDDSIVVAALGLAIHALVGLMAAWLYVEFVEPRLVLGPVGAGLVYGVGLWVLAQVVAVPSLGLIANALGRLDAINPGWLSVRLGLGAAVASLVAHLAYGITLGFVYGCRAGAQCR